MKKLFPLEKIDNKKGQTMVAGIWALVALAIGITVLAIVNGLGADILDDIQDDQTSNEYDYNASEEGLKGIDKVAGFTTTVATVGVAAVLIAFIIAAFGGVMAARRR